MIKAFISHIKKFTSAAFDTIAMLLMLSRAC